MLPARLRGELARFVLVGLTAVAIDFAVYRGLLALGLDLHAAKVAGYVGGAVFAYVANRTFTFRLDTGVHRRELLRFVAVYLGALAANVLVNWAVLALLGRSEVTLIAAFVCATGVSATLNFIGLKLLVFGHAATNAPTDDAAAAMDPSTTGISVDGVRLSLVIPCYNEARNLPLLVRRLREVLDGDGAEAIDAEALDAEALAVEVILVDNGSTDDSAEVLRELLAGQTRIRSVQVERNQGYGFGILAGLRAARGTILGWTHADMQTDPGDALRGLAAMGSAPEAVGRFVKGRRYGRPPADVAFTVGMSVFETLLLRRAMWDINAQPTMFPRAFFERWQDPPHDFALDLYAYYQAKRSGLQVRRVRVRFGERAHGVSHWNVNWRAKLRFIQRTVDFSLRMRRDLRGHA
ncbi:GtrA family protein [Montanilutibacter psychrotolerans]|uniref:Glycosyltransferase n=1 Tax=Montanilutibacter psychrotolerans TaxID=1327343 RepID=A0A3M8SM01_9GAMM|nr:GtrA family protein [Lysobacter psychrotolerans]RNF82341.1 glycosyltransferase [Lysobacter psychrotolerans]